MEEERQAVLSWPQYLARGVSPRAGPSTDGEEEVSVERANKVLDKLGAIFKDDLCLTPFSRTMAVEFVKKQVARGGDHFYRVLQFILNTINGKPCRTLEQKGCPNMIPGLRAKPFWDPAQFQWVEHLENNFSRIRAEFRRLKDLGENFQPYRAPPASSSATETVGAVATSKGNWNVCYLRLHEMDFRSTLDLCPATDETIRAIPRQYNHSLFSALAPNTHVSPHYGPTNKKLRCHLPLVVPGQEQCSITVNGETAFLEEGKCIVFDDSFYHEAINTSNLPRVVLIVDVWHPDLSDEEVKFLSFLDKAQFRAANRQVQERTEPVPIATHGGGDSVIAGLKPEADENFFTIITRAKEQLQSPKSEIWD